MDLIIAGSRSLESSVGGLIDRKEAVRRAIGASDEFELEAVSRVISGTADGPDTWGEQFADSEGISVKRMPADWERHGKAAGPKRNADMAKEGDALLAFWDGESSGTQNMIKWARSEGLPVTLIRMDDMGIRKALVDC